MKTTYRYIANNMESYLSLVQFVAVSPLVQTTLFPATKTVVVAYGEENGVLLGVSEHIHDNALDIRMEPIDDCNDDYIQEKALDPESLLVCLDEKNEFIGKLQSERDEVSSKLKDANIEKNRYCDWWMKADADLKTLNDQLNALMTLMKGIIKE